MRISREIAKLHVSALVLLLMAAPALAAQITYDGTAPPLQATPALAGTVHQNSLFVGDAANPAASGNTITIDFTSGANPWRAFGGVSNTETSVGNTVNMLRGTVDNRIYGGYDGANNNASGNSVLMSGGTVLDRIYGAHSISGGASSNSVSVTGGEVKSSVVGGSVGSNGTAAGNSVTVGGGGTVVGGWVQGGSSASGLAAGNTVTVFDGAIAGGVEGGGGSGTAISNNVFIYGGTITREVWGGYGSGIGAFDNKVSMSGGTVQQLSGGQGYSTTGNQVIFSGGLVYYNVYGGMSLNGASANGNSVIISGGTVMGMSPVDGVFGGMSNKGDAKNNIVRISGGEVRNVYGGSASLMAAQGGGDAAGNQVIISGGKFNGNVYGGLVASNTSRAVDNTVSISGDADLSKSAVYGGGVYGSQYGGNPNYVPEDLVSGNTLNVTDYQGLAVKKIANFQTVNISGDTNLTLAEGLSVSSAKNIAFALTQTSGTFNWDGQNRIDTAGGGAVNLTGGVTVLQNDFSLASNNNNLVLNLGADNSLNLDLMSRQRGTAFFQGLAGFSTQAGSVMTALLGDLTAEPLFNAGRWLFGTGNGWDLEALNNNVNLLASIGGLLYTGGIFTADASGLWVNLENLTVTPIPGALWLLGSGLAGLAVLRRKGKR